MRHSLPLYNLDPLQCNNPQTKEPKLDSAMRIIPEWKSYDQEIKDVIAKYQKGAAGKKKVSAEKKDEDHVEL